MRVAVGVDLGGTNIKSGIVRESDGAVLARFGGPTESQAGPGKVLEQLLEIARNAIDSDTMRRVVAEGATFAGVGLGSPGAIDHESGHVDFMSDNVPGWGGTDIRGAYLDSLEMDVLVDNDANVNAFGEYLFGAGREAKALICLTLGTGIGGGIVIEGEIYHGASGYAGEFGHIPVEETGPICTCGKQGCLEMYSSGNAIASVARERVSAGDASILRERCPDLEDLTAETVHGAALEGDSVALSVITRAARTLGRGISGLVASFDPDRVVIGGGVAAMGNLILEPVREVLEERVFFFRSEKCKIVSAELGNDAGVVGAAGLVFKRTPSPRIRSR